TVGRELKQKVQLQDLLTMSERQGVNSDGKNVFFNSPFFDPRLIGEDEKAGNPLYVDPNSTPQSNRISIPARPEARPESWHVYDTGSGKNGVVNPDYLDLHPRLPSRCEHGVMSHDPETGTPIYICQQYAWIG